MPTYLTKANASFTISTGQVSADCFRWGFTNGKPLARVTTFADTTEKYAPGLSDGGFFFDVNIDDAGSLPPIPTGTQVTVTGGIGTSKSYAHPVIIERMETSMDRDGQAQRAFVRFTGKLNGAVTVS